MNAKTASIAEEVSSLRREVLHLRTELSGSRRELLTRGAADDKETPDPTPLALPVDYERPETMQEMIQKYVQFEYGRRDNPAMGTFEEEDDFEEADPEGLPWSDYELTEFQMDDETPVDLEDASSSKSAEPAAEPGSEATEDSPSEETAPPPPA